MESSPAEKDLGLLVDEKLNITWQYALTAQKVNHLHPQQRGQQVEGGDSARFGKTPPGVLRSSLEPSVQERHGPVGAGPEEGDKNYPGAGAPLL